MEHKGVSVQSPALCRGQRFSLLFLRDLKVRRSQGERAGRLRGRMRHVEGVPSPGGVYLLPSETWLCRAGCKRPRVLGLRFPLLQGITAGLHA